MSFDPDRIPIWLRRTPEQQAADDALQEQLKTAYGPGSHPNPTERHLMRARAIEVSARAQLAHLDTLQPDEVNPSHIATACAQLAESRAAQGAYIEAAGIHPDPEHCARYRAIAAAIVRPDDDQCGCQDQRVSHPLTGKQITIPIENVDEIVYDPRYGKMQPLIKCHGCGELNVKPAPQRIAHRMANIVRKEP